MELNQDDQGMQAQAEPQAEETAEPQEPPFEVPTPLQADASFLTGGAGCGKTYLSKRIVAHESGVVLAASTGIAAVNLGEGTTINALLKYFDTASLQDSYTSGRLGAILGRLYRSGVRRIILDEVSMVPAEQLTVMARALEELSGKGYTLDARAEDDIVAQQIEEDDFDATGERRWPIKLTVVGDFCQLAPVKASYAFESPEWGRFDPNIQTLTQIHRQKDPAFVEALRAARRGDGEAVASFFHPILSTTSDPRFDGTTIFAKNEEVDRYNGIRMDQLSTSPQTFSSSRWGTLRADWKNIPESFVLKEGALVMILANRREGMGSDRLVYANGDLGHVIACDGEKGLIHVELARNGQTVEIEWVVRKNEIPLEVGRAKALREEGHPERIIPERKMEVVGEVKYLPVRVAYGSTVHKTQGLSLDQVQINIRDAFFRTPAMLYVALSRARSLEGLRVVGTVQGLRERCTIDARVKRWI